MKTYSNSKIGTYEQCPKKYDFKYIQKIQTDIPTTIEAFMGDLVHRALEKLYKDLTFTKLNSKEQIISYYEDLWESEWDESILIVKDYESYHYKEKGKKMLEEYYDSYKPFDDGKTIGLETQDFYDLNDKYKIHIRVDRLVYKDGVYEIHDYKTNNTLKTQKEADEDRQLAIYALGIKEMFKDAKKVELVWHFLAFNKEIRSTRTDEELQKLREEIIKDIEEIETCKEFPTKKSALCDYCEYKSMCPAWKHLFEIENGGETKVTELIDDYVKLKNEEKEMSEKAQKIAQKIKDVAKQKKVSVLYSDKYQVTIWSKETFKFPNKSDPLRKEFRRVMKSLNLYDLYSDIDNWDLEKDFDKLPQVHKSVLKNFARKEEIFRLYPRERK